MHGAAHTFHQFVHDGQAEPAGVLAPFRHMPGHVEPLEHVRQIVGGDAWPVVVDPHHDIGAVGCSGDGDGGTGILRGVQVGALDEDEIGPELVGPYRDYVAMWMAESQSYQIRQVEEMSLPAKPNNRIESP